MPLWTYNEPPLFHNPKDPRAVATPKGWTDPTTGEVLVAIGELTTKDGSVATLVQISLDSQAYSATGSVMTLTVEYDQDVTVTGTPTVSVVIGTNTRTFTYASGSGSAYLTFTYTTASDSATAGQVSVTSPISGTIKITGTSTAAPLTFAGTQVSPLIASTTV
jgi:hypothetical protein